jgi:hypothetical protein
VVPSVRHYHKGQWDKEVESRMSPFEKVLEYPRIALAEAWEQFSGSCYETSDEDIAD